MWKTLFRQIEEIPFSIASFAAAFLGIIGVRQILEALSSPTSTGALTADPTTILHYCISYLAILFTIAYILHRSLRVPEHSTLMVSLFGLVLIWISPLMDLFLTLGHGMSMAYVFAAPWQLLGDLISFFGPFVLPGITIGIRFEVLVMCVILFLYARSHGRSLFHAVFTALAGYAAIFVYVALPSVMSFVHDVFSFSLSQKNSAVIVWFQDVAKNAFLARTFLHPTIRLSQDRLFEVLFNVAMSQIFFWIVGAFILRAAFVYREKITRALMANMRPARVIHYSVLVLSGFALALQSHQGKMAWNWLDVSTLALTLVAFWSAWMFAVCVNDIVDESTDQISNTHRPLITGALSADLLRKAAGGFLATTAIAGFLTGTYTLFFLGTFTAAYWVYSVPPLRLKRVPILSNFLVGVACLSAFLAGFYLVSIDRTLHAVSFPLIAFVLVGFTAAANVKDIKDIAGDRAEGVLTLPVWLGERKARRVIGGMIALVFLAAPLAFGSILWIPSVAAACLSFAVCVQAKSPERGIFALYFLFVAVAYFLL